MKFHTFRGIVNNTDFVVVKRIEVIAKLECKEYRVCQDVRLDVVM